MTGLTVRQQVFCSALLGILIGGIILVALSLPTKWAAAILAASAGALILISFAGQIEKVAFACFVFFLPIELGKSFFYMPYAGGGHELRISISQIFFLVLLPFWVARIIRHGWRGRINSWLLVSGIVFLLTSILSLSKATNVSLGIFELIRAGFAFLVFLVVVSYVDNKLTLKQTIVILLLGCLPQLGIGIYQWLFERDIGLRLFGEMGLVPEAWGESSIVRVGGLLGHPNAFATYLVMTLPLSIVLWTKEHKILTRLVAFFLFMIGVAVLLATGSRGGWVGFGLATLAAFSALMFYGKRVHLKRWRVVSLMILCLLCITVAGYPVIEKRFLVDDRGSAASRIPMMFDAGNVIFDNPLLGVGINNYSLSVGKYDVTGIHQAWEAAPVHNLFLLIGAESGVIAMLSFIVFWIVIARHVGNLIRSGEREAFLLGVALMMSLVGFFVIHQVDPNYRFYPSIQRELWLIGGMALAAAKLNQGASVAGTPLPRKMNAALRNGPGSRENIESDIATHHAS